jgi:hypothetical protein
MLIPIAQSYFETFRFYMVAGSQGGFTGYIKNSFGSVTGNLNADGGTVERLFTAVGLHNLYILNGNQSATKINIDGEEYPLTYIGPDGSLDYYRFSPPTVLFVSGNKYKVIVT